MWDVPAWWAWDEGDFDEIAHLGHVMDGQEKCPRECPYYGLVESND